MKAKQITRWTIAGAMGALMLYGGTAGAADYPPGNTTVTTVAVGGVSGIVSPSAAATAAAPTAGELPATGSDSDTTLKLAGGALVAGAGLVVAAKLRRRPVAA